jgi:hypothetical protein
VLHGSVGDLAEQMGDAVEAGALLVDRFHDPPGRLRDMGALG